MLRKRSRNPVKRGDGLIVDSYKESWFLFSIIPWCRTHGESSSLLHLNEDSELAQVRRLGMLSSGCNNTFLYSSYILVRGGLASNLNTLPLQALELVMGSQIIIHFICMSGHEDYLGGNYQLRQFKPRVI